MVRKHLPHVSQLVVDRRGMRQKANALATQVVHNFAKPIQADKHIDDSTHKSLRRQILVVQRTYNLCYPHSTPFCEAIFFRSRKV
jgi:hypothetical protein